MSEDLGVNDVVACERDGHYIGADLQIHGISAGARSRVSAIRRAERYFCEVCNAVGVGIEVADYPTPDIAPWCLCAWRKIGGSQTETVARFAHHLTPASPEKVDA